MLLGDDDDRIRPAADLEERHGAPKVAGVRRPAEDRIAIAAIGDALDRGDKLIDTLRSDDSDSVWLSVTSGPPGLGSA